MLPPPPPPPPPSWQPQSIAKQKTENKTTTITTVINNPPQNPLKPRKHKKPINQIQKTQQLKPRKRNQNPLDRQPKPTKLLAPPIQSHESTCTGNQNPLALATHDSDLTSMSMPTIMMNTPISPQCWCPRWFWSHNRDEHSGGRPRPHKPHLLLARRSSWLHHPWHQAIPRLHRRFLCSFWVLF